MRTYLNLKGEKIGFLTVLELSEQKKNTTKLWKCKCICGNIVYKTSSKLKEAQVVGYNISCGCSKNKEDLTNKVYNDIKVLEYVKDLPRCNRLWKCICTNCGETLYLTTTQLKKNNNICKHNTKEKNKIRKYLHNCLARMKNRCYNINCSNYKYYGGKGIKICDEWLNNSETFIKWSLENGYKIELTDKGYNSITIDRIDFNGDYCPENCRWINAVEQANNKSNNTYYTYDGHTMSLAQWCRTLSLNYKYVHFLIKNKHKTFEEAIAYKKRG